LTSTFLPAISRRLRQARPTAILYLIAFIDTHQCDEGQGFYFSRAVCAEQFGQLFKGAIKNGCVPPLAAQAKLVV